ncbi:MAG: hypothetical protein NZM00_15025, partial [Anaerolinea sp.]|nr:hypothetical protein [Anaerolinea sp.]
MAKVTFGSYLRELLHNRNWSADKLACEIYGDMVNNRNAVNRWLRIGEQASERSKGNTIEDYTIEQLAQALNLSYLDKFYMYGLAGKIPPLPLPSFEEVTRILDPLVPGIEAWPYPAYILDKLHFRFWAVNASAIAAIGGRARVNELVNCTVFQLLFCPRYRITDLFGNDLETVQRAQIRYYKTLNVWVRHEAYYMEYPERLRDRDGLTEEEYAVFERLWNETFPYSVNPNGSRPHIQISAAAIPFDLVPTPILDLNNLFYIIWYHLRADNSQTEARIRQMFVSLLQRLEDKRALK